MSDPIVQLELARARLSLLEIERQQLQERVADLERQVAGIPPPPAAPERPRADTNDRHEEQE